MIFYDFLRKSILPLEEIDKALPEKGKIFDLGCGRGVIARYLAKSKKRIVVGIDSNNKRLPRQETKNLFFISGDLRRVSLEGLSGVVISDVLHHLNLADQKNLLKKIARGLKKEGVLVIKEIDAGEFFRSRLSRIWDLILYPHDKINYWQYQDLTNFLKELGFRVKISKPCRFFPGSTTLFVCKKWR